MADQSKRGGQKKGTAAGSQSKQHQGVRPDSTTQDKAQRQRQAQRGGGNKNKRVSEKRPGS